MVTASHARQMKQDLRHLIRHEGSVQCIAYFLDHFRVVGLIAVGAPNHERNAIHIFQFDKKE